ncbi:HNH endonuclease signature motif containing protein [Granulicella mallensis]|uniref:5-methylcytosine-specific restriction endonuclease McrA n=1 Tax=Granulicella mallensis TaxID=940614 RepID=A0A7W8E9I9_9BACT|nr:HNH endonuclease signature motif containing protein [Granulicella mallensis]MBB5063751.1 5-methylcytosine-specific restriction endonuclease McrA [Granulicella mallensis]
MPDHVVFLTSPMSTLPSRILSEAGRAQRAALSLGPNGLALCRWCQMEILARRRRTFCSEYCVHQWRLRSDPGYLRDQVFARDCGVCTACGTDTVAAYAALKRSRGKARVEALAVWGLKTVQTRRSLWDADHIRPVAEGGGQCDLDNLRTLCLPCHREATADLRLRLRANTTKPRPSPGLCAQQDR